MNYSKSKLSDLCHSEQCGRERCNKGYGKGKNDNLFSIPFYTTTKDTTQSTESYRRLNETASKIPESLIKCASQGRFQKILPPFIRIAGRRGIDRALAIALLDRAPNPKIIREGSKGGSGSSGYDCGIPPDTFNITRSRLRKIKSKRELAFIAEAWGFPLSDLLIAWEKRGGEG